MVLSEQECRSDGRSRTTLTASESSKSTGPMSSDTGTSEESNGQKSSQWTLSAEDSPANQLVSVASGKVRKTNAGCGQISTMPFARLTPNGSWQKMYRGCSQSSLDNSLVAFSGTWPKWGMMQNGEVFRQQPLVLISEAKECMSLPVVPRPTACDAKGSGRIRYERLSVGPNLRDWFNAKYNFAYPPASVDEYLMGFPLGWTDLGVSETRSSRRSRSTSGKRSSKRITDPEGDAE